MAPPLPSAASLVRLVTHRFLAESFLSGRTLVRLLLGHPLAGLWILFRLLSGSFGLASSLLRPSLSSLLLFL